VAPPEKVGGNIIGGFIPYIIIILCFTGAMYPAIDLTAGEKERGTMETLLCSPVNRVNIALGKFLMVADRLAGNDHAVADRRWPLRIMVGGSLLGAGKAWRRRVQPSGGRESGADVYPADRPGGRLGRVCDDRAGGGAVRGGVARASRCSRRATKRRRATWRR